MRTTQFSHSIATSSHLISDQLRFFQVSELLGLMLVGVVTHVTRILTGS